MKFSIFSVTLFVLICPNVLSQSINGIDVSQWQGSIDWVQVKASGNAFAYARATEGLSNTDNTFQTNMIDGLAAGMIMGSYCFGRPDVSATGSAQHFVSVVGPYIGQGYLPPVIDIETTEGMSYAAISTWVQDWITEVEQLTGITPIIYTGAYFGAELSQSLNIYPLWVAHWGVSSPTILGGWDDWLFWQHTGTGNVAGISGNVNLNIFNGDSIALDSLTGFGGITGNEMLSTADDFNIFPNPVDNLLSISTSPGSYCELILSDMAGRVLREEAFLGSISIETTFLENGMYVCQLSTADGHTIRKTVLKK